MHGLGSTCQGWKDLIVQGLGLVCKIVPPNLVMQLYSVQCIHAGAVNSQGFPKGEVEDSFFLVAASLGFDNQATRQSAAEKRLREGAAGSSGR